LKGELVNRLICLLGFFYVVYVLINLGNLLTRIKNQFEDSELKWSYTHEWVVAGIIHSLAEVVVFLLLSFPATIHCIVVLPSIFQEVYKKHKLQPRE